MFKSKDIMNPKVICVRPEMPIYEAIRLLTRSNLPDLPVVDEDLRFLGILSDKDIFKLLYNTKDNSCLVVNDLMNPFITSFEIDTNLIELCDSLASHTFQRIPITQNGILVGIVSPADIIETILKLKRQDNKIHKAS